jgi:DNA gyrase subunit B
MPQSPILRGLEAVRRRPGMYIGGTDERALHVCVVELVANSIEEFLAGRSSSIVVTIHDDGSLSVKDDGGAISVAENPVQKISFLELALTTMSFRSNNRSHSHFGMGSHGVGTKCVNAVSEWMRVNTVQEGKEYVIEFARGQVSKPLAKLSESTAARGTTIRFKPDAEILKVTKFNRNLLAARFEGLAVLYPGLEFWLLDERPNTADRALVSRFHFPKGIADFLKIECPREWHRRSEPVVLQGDVQGIKIALGFQYMEGGNSSVLSFVNGSPTPLNGTHVQGFLQGMADAFTELSGRKCLFRPKDTRSGLNALIAIWLEEPHYGGATKDKLDNPEVEVAVREFTVNGVRNWIREAGQKAQWLMEFLDEERRGEQGAAQRRTK